MNKSCQAAVKNKIAGVSLCLVIIALSGCITMRMQIETAKEESSPNIGCPTEEIEISDLRGLVRWTATCHGHRFLCGSVGQEIHCAPEIR